MYTCSMVPATLACDMLKLRSFVFSVSTESDTDVHLSTATQDDDVQKNSSLLRHVRLISPTEGLRIYGRPPHLDHVTVFNSTTSGLSLTDILVGRFSARHCDFSGNQLHGIYIYSRESNVHADITHTTLNDNGQAGVMVEYLSSGSVTMSRNMFGNNLQYALHARSVSGSLALANNTFSNNTSTFRPKPIVNLQHVFGGHLQVVDNTFMHNRVYDKLYSRLYANYVIYLAAYNRDTDYKVSIVFFTSPCICQS